MTLKKCSFSELGLSKELLQAVADQGFEEASPIQAEAIPVILGGSDVIGQAATGSGKTAAFAIPVIEKVNPALKRTQVCVLSASLLCKLLNSSTSLQRISVAWWYIRYLVGNPLNAKFRHCAVAYISSSGPLVVF
ncbi:DEAD/DEAH box helicase [bacterium]|nr:DEAD/DEAH box helicase [bacterium]